MLEPSVQDSLRLETQVQSPKEHNQYRLLEQEYTKQLVDIYGPKLTRKQKNLISNSGILITRSETQASIMQEWAVQRPVNNEKTPLNNLIYIGYGPKQVELLENQDIQGFAGRSGIVSYALDTSYDTYAVSPEYVNASQHDKDNLESSSSLSPDDRMDKIKETAYESYSSIEFARNVIHEKVHMLQDYDLPLPLLEAQSYYIQRKIMQNNKAGRKAIQFEMNGLADFYQELLQEFGQDIHLLLWGNIKDKKQAQQLLTKVKAKMTVDKLKSLLPEHYEWKTNPYKD